MSLDNHNSSNESVNIEDSANSLGQKLISAEDINSGLEDVARTLVEIFDVERSVIVTYNADINSALHGAAYDRSNDEYDENVISSEIPAKILQLLTPTKFVRISARELSALSSIYAPFKNRLAEGNESLVVTGIHWQGKPVGWFALWSSSESDFSSESLDLLDQIAKQIAAPIGYLQLNRKLELDYQNQVDISAMAESISSAKSVEEGLEKFTKLLSEFFGANRASVQILEIDNYAVIENHTYTSTDGYAQHAGISIKVPDQLLTLFHDHKPTRIDRSILEKYSGEFPPYANFLNDGMTVGINTRLWWQGELVGAISLFSDNSESFSPYKTYLLQEIADRVAGSIGYLRLNRQLDDDIQTQSQISEMVTSLSNSDSVEDGFQTFAKLVDQFFGGTRMGAAVYEPESMVLTDRFGYSASDGFYHFRGLNDATSSENYRVPINHDVNYVDRARLESYASEYPKFAEKLTEDDQSAITTMLWWQNLPVGSISIFGDSSDSFGIEQTTQLARIAESTSGAIGFLLANRGLENRYEHQAALSKIGQIVGSALELESVFVEALPVIRELIEFTEMKVTTLDIETNTYTILFDSRIGKHGYDVQRSGPLTGSITALTQASSGPVRVQAQVDDEGQAIGPISHEQESHGIKSAIGAPLISDGIIYGSVTFRSDREKTYTEVPDELLLQISAQLSGAISYHRVNERLTRELREQIALARISQIVGSELDLKSAFDAVGETLSELVPNTAMFANTIDIAADTREDIYIGFADPNAPFDAELGNIRPLKGSLAASVIDTRVPNRINIDEDGSWRGGDSVPMSAARGELSAVCIPLLSEGNVFGSLQFRSPIRRAYDAITDDFLAKIGAHMAGVIAYKQVNATLETELIEQSMLARIGQIIGSELELDSVFAEVSTELSTLIDFDVVFVTTLDKEKTRLRNIFCAGKLAAPFTDLQWSGVTDKNVEQILKSSDPHRVDLVAIDRKKDPSQFKLARELDLKSALMIPLISEGIPFAILNLRSSKRHAYDNVSDDFLQRIGEQIAGAVALDQVNHKLEVELREQSALARISQIIGSNIEIESVFDQVAEALAEIIDFDVTMVTVPSTDKRMMRNVPVAGKYASEYIDSGWYSAPNTLASRTISNRSPIRESIKTSTKSDPTEDITTLGLSDSLGIRSALAIPLISANVPFAALQFRSELEAAFDKFSDDFLNRIAEQIAGAIALDQINEKLEAELTEQTALARIGQLIGSSTDIGTVFSDIAIALRQVLEFDTVLVNSIDNDSGTRVVLHQSGEVTKTTLVGERRLLKGSLTEKVFLTRKVLRSVRNDEFANEYSVVLPDMKDGFKSQIAIPLISQNEVVGTLQFRSFKDDTYPQSQFRFLTLVGEQISGGMARTELSESQVVLSIERERAEGLESQNLELVQNRRIREQFLGMVTHELRTPLTSISAFTDILGHNKEGTLTERQLQQLSAVSRNSTQLSELIDDLIHMSRMERGDFELNVEQTDLVEIVKQVCESMAPVMQHRDQKLVSGLDIPRLRLNLDHSRITQVLNNLISNSSKFSPKGSTVTVNMTASDDNAQIDVIDEGPGINSEEFETVFDPFYRIDNEAAKLVPGTGLGLYVARTIVRQHGGEVSIASGSNGTTFRIVIPIENPNI